MATARIRYQWPDGDALECEITVSESFPDAVAEARAATESMYAVALGVTLAPTAGEKADQEGGDA